MWVLIVFLYYKPYEEPYRIELPFDSYDDCIELGRQTKELRKQFGADGIDTVCIMQSPDIPVLGSSI